MKIAPLMGLIACLSLLLPIGDTQATLELDMCMAGQIGFIVASQDEEGLQFWLSKRFNGDKENVICWIPGGLKVMALGVEKEM